MLIEAAHRAEAAAKEMLALVDAGSASCSEMREALEVSKAFMAVGSAFQASAAQVIAKAERHGDGGAEVLAASTGLSRREAQSQVKTAETLREAPKLRDAVADGRLSIANAKQLATAVERTSAADVNADGELLAKAESMRPEQFAREARRWAVEREGDSGASEHSRQRARRCVRMWNGDDGMVRLYGEFDPVTGRRIHNRLRAEARRLYDADRKHASSGRADRRNFDQCMADALDHLTANRTNGAKPFADICLVAHVDDATGDLVSWLSCPTVPGCPSRCSKNSLATQGSPGSSTTARAEPYGELNQFAAPPKPSARCSSPVTGAVSPVESTPTCAMSTMSGRCRRAGRPASTTWCWHAGAATPRSTTSAGGSTAHPETAPCIHPTV